MNYSACCRVLRAAVLAKAVKDAREGDVEARDWLLTDDAYWCAGCLDITWPPNV